MKKVTLQIKGMHCDACAKTIEKALLKEKGIVSAKVNFTLGKAAIEYDPEKIDKGKIKRAIKKQLDSLEHVLFAGFTHKSAILLAEKILSIAPKNLTKVFFSDNGSTSVETAMKMSFQYWKNTAKAGRSRFISLDYGYHGDTIGTMSVSGKSIFNEVFSPMFFSSFKVPSPYCYRCPLHLKYPDCGVACAQDIEELILTSTSGKVACFLAEPIQGVGGFITPPPEYFQIAVEIVRKYGGVFIADEVQTGFGRTGGKMFGIEHWEVEPEIMTFAKGFANGFPIGGTIATEEVADAMTGLTISTFGGNPVSCTAALATVDIVVKEKLVQHVAEVGDYFFNKLYELQEKHPSIGDVRGKGLMIGVEIVKENKEPDAQTVLKIFELTKEKRLLIGKGGLYGNVLRITPPLNIEKGDVDEAVKILDEVFGKI